MSEPKGSRVVIKSEESSEPKTKSAAQIVKENEELNARLSLKKKDKLKQAIRDNNFQSVATEPSTVIEEEAEVSTEVEVLDMRKKSGEEVMEQTVTAKRHVSLNFGVVGSGQAGGRIAEVFSHQGYKTCVINTAQQDLEFLNVPEEDKYLIDNNKLGGTGKDLDISAECFESQETEIRDFLDEKIGECDVSLLIVSGAGGTGAGSAELLSTWLYEMGKPVIVMFVLPGAFDDTQGKHNAVTTLGLLSDMCSKGIITSLVLVDNAAIEAAYPDLPPSQFWPTANKAVAQPLHLFNSLSVSPTKYEAFDDLDFSKSLLESSGFCVMGSNKVPKDWYEDDETALMEAIIEGLDGGLLARGFDLKEAQTVGVLVVAKESVLETIPYSSISYMFKYISDEFDSAKAFRGIYGVPSDSDDIEVHFMFSGLGMPKTRVENLKAESEKHLQVLKDKKAKTQIATGASSNDDMDKVERKIARIKKKKTGLGKLLNPGKPVRRRR